MRKRSKSILVRFSEDEYAKLQCKLERAGVSLQTYMLNAALGVEIATSAEIEEYKAISRRLAEYEKQLRGMGTNINQMAHLANSYGSVPSINELEKLKEEVGAMRAEVHERWLLTRQSISARSHMVP